MIRFSGFNLSSQLPRARSTMAWYHHVSKTLTFLLAIYVSKSANGIIITQGRLRLAVGELDAINHVRFLYIYRALGD